MYNVYNYIYIYIYNMSIVWGLMWGIIIWVYVPKWNMLMNNHHKKSWSQFASPLDPFVIFWWIPSGWESQSFGNRVEWPHVNHANMMKHGLNALLALLTQISRRCFFLCSKDQIGSAPLQSLKLSLSVNLSLSGYGWWASHQRKHLFDTSKSIQAKSSIG